MLIEDPDRQQHIPDNWFELREKTFRELDWIDSRTADFATESLRECVAELERLTGAVYDEGVAREFQERSNETCRLYWQAADLAYTSPRPAPFSITDAYSEVAVFETHLGEDWALEHVRKFYDEVKSRSDSGKAVCPDERVRILWGSTPLWFNLGFYNQWEQSHGAIFMEMNYLPRAERMIVPDLTDPIRAAMLRRHMRYSGSSPLAAAALHVAQARKYHADGVIIPAKGATRGASGAYYYVRRGLERAGIPVLTLDYNPLGGGWDDAEMNGRVQLFIESIGRHK